MEISATAGKTVQAFASARTLAPSTESYHRARQIIGSVLETLPSSQRWHTHLTNELMPFWMVEEAKGCPHGNFPTYRTNEGKLFDPYHPPIEFRTPVDGIVWLDRQHIRTQARQTYVYGVAYHVTGDRTYLQLARDGVDFFLEHALDPDGCPYEYLLTQENGHGAPNLKQRTSQSMAYALMGIGFYYYLTHDPKLLDPIISIKNAIFSTYLNKHLDLFQWVLEPSPDGDTPDQKELVAQLDQIFAYMIWLTPALPLGIREKWFADMDHIAKIIISQFYGPQHQLFWGSITSVDNERYGQPHTDFGHSVKTFWLLHQLGKMRGDLFLNTFGADHAAHILSEAFLEDGTWARMLKPSGAHDCDKEWWICAVLDQTAATLALLDPGFASYLTSTYACWFDYMVDKEHGEIWHYVDWQTKKPVMSFPKQHAWKNGEHSLEHMLVAYITTHQLHRETLPLYYALENQDDPVQPYSFLAREAGRKQLNAHEGETDKLPPTCQITFTDIR